MIKIRKKQNGMTLVEVMIALVLASLIILAVVNLFLTNYRNYRMEEGISRIQENGRFALDILGENIRQGGFSGCRRVGPLNVQVIATSGAAGFSDPNEIVLGYENGAGVPASISAHISPNTDAITIRKAGSCSAALDGVSKPNANIKVVPNECDFKQNDIVMVSDCTDAHIFQITNNPASGTLTHANGNDANHLCKSYNNPMSNGACKAGADKSYNGFASVRKLESVTYYIRENTANVNSLYEQVIKDNKDSDELVEGVEDMDIEYGVDLTGNGSADPLYLKANAVIDWGQVVSVRVSLLLNSISDDLVDEKFVPTTITPINTQDGLEVTPLAVDGQIRRVVSTTIGLRNAVP